MYTGTTAKIKRFCEPSTTNGQINEYSRRVRAGQIECNLPPCSRCKQGSDSFTRHKLPFKPTDRPRKRCSIA